MCWGLSTHVIQSRQDPTLLMLMLILDFYFLILQMCALHCNEAAEVCDPGTICCLNVCLTFVCFPI